MSISKEERKNNIKEWLQKPGNNFCSLPFIHLAVEANGDLLPCCQGSPILEDTGHPVNIKNYNSYNDLWNHPQRKAFLDDFKLNKQSANCHKCWKDKTKFSPRMNFSTNSFTLDKTEELIELAKSNEPIHEKLSWLEVKFGNRCNLKCRICGNVNSSAWARDEFELTKKENIDFKQSKESQYNKDCLWIDDLSVHESVEGMQDLKVFHIMGGEPLMVPEHFLFLDKFSKEYDSSQTLIWYNTNGTIKLNQKYEDILNRFKRVNWSLSIDDIGPRFEYQRKNAKWNMVEKNINYYFDLTKKFKNHKTIMDLTVSIFNLFYLKEIIEYFDNQNWKQSTFSHFVKTGVHSIRTLSNKQKEIVLDFYKDETHPSITNTLKFMTSQDLWSEVIEKHRINKIIKLDRLRSENFNETFNQMNKLLKNK